MVIMQSQKGYGMRLGRLFSNTYLLECNSTNCGNNITFPLVLLKQNKIDFNSIILAQDVTMQYRMEAGLRKYIDDNITIINYAVYSAKVIIKNSDLVFEDEILGMWDIDRYITLLMGKFQDYQIMRRGMELRGRGLLLMLIYQMKLKRHFLN